MTDIKTIKSQLKKLEYVKTLKTLTAEQRELLTKKYKERDYINVRIPIGNIECVESAKKVFAGVVSEMESKLSRAALKNVRPVRGRGYYNNTIVLSGYISYSDDDLIKFHLEHLEQEHKRNIEQQKIQQRRLRAASKTNVNLTVSSKRDAETLIKHLKNKFNV